MNERPDIQVERVGLCASCVHSLVIVSSKQSIFHQCRLAETDRRFARYPVLPVRTCAGYEPRTSQP